MVAHMSLPNVTGDNTPATLSKKVVTDMLKTELNFKGVVFSDSMSIIRYDSIRDYHVMNVRDLVFVMAAAGGIYRR